MGQRRFLQQPHIPQRGKLAGTKSHNDITRLKDDLERSFKIAIRSTAREAITCGGK